MKTKQTPSRSSSGLIQSCRLRAIAGALLLGFGVSPGARAAVSISQNPQSLSASPGGTAAFEVAAYTEFPPLAFQWQFFGTNLPGRTQPTLTLENVTTADRGPYTVIVSDSQGSTTSAAAVLDLDPTFVKISQSDATRSDGEMRNSYWVDYNQDGRLDLIVCGGFSTPGGRSLMIYDNMGGGILRRNQTNDLAQLVMRAGSITWADFDNDGDVDAFAGQWATTPGWYLRNEGQGRFTPIQATADWTANARAVYGSATASTDLDGDGWLDLLVASYGTIAGAFSTNAFLHGFGGGRFEVDTVSSLPLAFANDFTESLAWVDYDEDGDQDVFVATGFDYAQSDRLLNNNGLSFFTNDFRHGLLDYSSTITVGQHWADYDNDGDLDLAIAREPASVYRSLGAGRYEVLPGSTEIPVIGVPTVPQWADYDNDGHLDLFMAYEGHRGRLFHNNGYGVLDELLTGSPSNDLGIYGCAWGDYDGDGFLDLFVVGLGGTNHLYRNNLPATGNTNHWLNVSLSGKASNRSGVGAAVRVRATIGGRTFWQRRQIEAQSHAVALEAHFGLGDAVVAEVVRIEWPSGIVQELQNVTAGQNLTVTEYGSAFKQSPSAFTVRPGTTITNRVRFFSSESAAVTYQWRFNGAALVDETNATLILTNVQLAQEGDYAVIGTGGSLSETSRVGRLAILIDPVITMAPVSREVPAGSAVTFSVGFTGNPRPFGVEWRQGSTSRASNVVSAPMDFFTVPNVQAADVGSWRVVVRNLARSAPGTDQNRSFTLGVAPDADDDRLPDDWERAHGFPVNDPANASQDPDQDGQSNLEEYQAGTDPRNAQSYLKVDSIARPDGASTTVLTFLAVSGRTYAVEGRREADHGSWTRVADVPAATTNRVMMVPDRVTELQRYYRLLTPRVP